MANDLKTLQDEILYFSPKDLTKKGFAQIKGNASRDYVAQLDIPDALQGIIKSNGLLGGSLTAGDKYIFLEKDGGKDVAAYVATLECFYFINLGTNQERVLVASFQRGNAIVPLFEESVDDSNFYHSIVKSGAPKYEESKQSYLNLIDLNPATNAVNLTNDITVLPYKKANDEEVPDLILQPYNVSTNYGSGLDNLIHASQEDVDAVNAHNRKKKNMIFSTIIASIIAAVGLGYLAVEIFAGPPAPAQSYQIEVSTSNDFDA